MNKVNDTRVQAMHEKNEKVDFSNFSKEELLEKLKQLNGISLSDYAQYNKIIADIKKTFSDFCKKEQKEALKVFIENGGEEKDFTYKKQEIDTQFFDVHSTVQKKIAECSSKTEDQRQKNLIKKQELLERLRKMVSNEILEKASNSKLFNNIQAEWEAIGDVPSKDARKVMANFNALKSHYYNNKRIYFELQQQGSKKNEEERLKLCKRAEELIEKMDTQYAYSVREFDKLREQFANLGRSYIGEKEAINQFKTLCHEFFLKRKEIKRQCLSNENEKTLLLEKIKPFTIFNSTNEEEWRKKSSEIFELQKKWEKIGYVSKKMKSINKEFWHSLKSFFNNKSNFSKTIKEENLKQKQMLLEEAKSYENSQDVDAATKSLIKLQQKWKAVGEIPGKYRKSLYEQFNQVCNSFFDKKRQNKKKLTEENIIKKQEIYGQFTLLVENVSENFNQIKELINSWQQIKTAKNDELDKKIRNLAKDVVKCVEKDKMQHKEIKAIFASDDGKKAIARETRDNRKLKQQIVVLQNEVIVWQNNISFLANSKAAIKLKEEYEKKINNAQKKLDKLKESLD